MVQVSSFLFCWLIQARSELGKELGAPTSVLFLKLSFPEIDELQRTESNGPKEVNSGLSFAAYRKQQLHL